MAVQVVAEPWDAHYRRMQRSYAKLATHTAPPFVMDHYEDDLYHFFQDAWHLKDWIRNDSAAGAKAPNIEAEVKAVAAFMITADLANGTKHRVLTIEKFIRKGAVISERIRSVRLRGGRPDENRWPVTLRDGTKTTAQQVAEDVMKAWDVLLKSYGLI